MDKTFNINAEATKAMVEYIGHKLKTGTTWEQLANKLTQRGICIVQNYADTIGHKVSDLWSRGYISSDVCDEFNLYVAAISHSFYTDDEIRKRLLVKLEKIDAPETEIKEIKNVIFDEFEG